MKKKINKATDEDSIVVKIPAYKKKDGTVTYIYDEKGNILDWYTPYPNMKTKIEKYKDLVEKTNA